MIKHIPVYKTELSGNEARYVNECLDSGWISSRGKFVERFENAFASYLGGDVSCTSVCNGTVALHLALYTLGIKEGDEVILPSLTYIASANAVRMVGATPVFVDADPDTWNINCAEIEKNISPKTKAILAVHLYGATCDMTALLEICQRHSLFLIEDVAEAFGSQHNGGMAGTFGDIATFSFFGNKTITTGEGGMVVSKHPEITARAALLKSQAVSRTKEYWHEELGFNYRMTNIAAAIGLAQLENADRIISNKRLLAMQYKSELKTTELRFQSELRNTLHTYWMISVLAKTQKDRDAIREKLAEVGVETRPLFHPMHRMPPYRSEVTLPISESVSKRGLNLPSWPGLPKDDVELICSVITNTIA